jgi:hypothetical protein
MLATHQDAEQRYAELRKLALETAQKGSSNALRLGTIDAAALAAASGWMGAANRQVDWDWAASYPSLRFRYPKRFEVAAWAAGELVALSFGRPTYHGHSLRLDFVEARPRSLGKRPPVFEEIEIAYDVYARLLNAKEIRIMNPINDEVRAYYESFGYEYVARQDFLFREVL